MELGRDKVVYEIVARLTAVKKGGLVKVEGTWGSFAPLLVSYISQQIHRPILYVRPHIDDADKATDDLNAFGAKDVQQLPAWEGAESIADATDEIRAERARIVTRTAYCVPRERQNDNMIITAGVQALQQAVPSPKALAENSITLKTGAQFGLDKLIKWLVDEQFERVDKVDMPGQFGSRGGIVDIYATLVQEENSQAGMGANQTTQALRLEFFGDTIESIRSIDLDSQRSSGTIEAVRIISPVTHSEDKQMFVDVLASDTLIVLEEPNDIAEVATVYHERAQDNERLFSWKQIYEGMSEFSQLRISRFAGQNDGEYLKVDVKSVQKYQPSSTTAWAGHKEALGELVEQSRGGKKVYLYCEAEAEIGRVKEIIAGSGKKIPKNLNLISGFINQGFVIDSLHTIVISHHELFGQFALRRRYRSVRASAPVDTLEDLQVGDYVVHASYGIGKYCGITTIAGKGPRSCLRQEDAGTGPSTQLGTGEYLTLEYADKVKVQVSVENIHLVQKYIGTSPKRPGLSKVGAKKWLKQKKKVEESVKDMATELLELQAKRQAAGGIAYGADSSWQVEFEESFAYQETADQTTAAEQIKSDMRQNIVMDRLLCGDVGYGKTELAMRAAFKAVENGRQVAVLVPTTVLCVQHGRTFRERFVDFPICIEVLNRFRTAKESRDIIERTKKGKVDVLIGTHRLLSKDIGFKDLGLLIIDEEQRFGVRHKEKLKKMRVNIDILTMTATPIPRTLHMSLLGLRDISSLGTPPLDRRAVVTQVGRYEPSQVKSAVYREMNRQGQVFFVHNRVKSIEKRTWELRRLFGDEKIKFDIAHGQMSKRQLETAMINFVLGKTNVLVCTTIIESGLDIPNANTIFIDDADRFGLAELHQLRGRVGRYKHRAYAYMLLPKRRTITPVAVRRLKAIEEYSHLGAGFRIALRDLEIRGAGNILGSEQSGHIQMVGYQMYCALLAAAVRRLRGEPVEEAPMVTIELGFSTYIPKNYIPADRSRMEVYRKIAAAKSPQDIDKTEAEVCDMYGQPPDEVKLLVELARLRIAAAKHGIKSIVASGNNLVFSLRKEARINAKELFKDTKGKIDITGPTTVYLRLSKNYFERDTLIMILKKILNKETKGEHLFRKEIL